MFLVVAKGSRRRTGGSPFDEEQQQESAKAVQAWRLEGDQRGVLAAGGEGEDMTILKNWR
jgi:hypothetical protein